jgi:hypothetical protein
MYFGNSGDNLLHCMMAQRVNLNMTPKSTFHLNWNINLILVKSKHYLYEVCNFVHWTRRCFERKPRGYQHIVSHYHTNSTLNGVESKQKQCEVFSKCLDDRDVASLCQISGVRISGRQFFPCEGVCECKKMFDITFTVAVMRMNTIIIIRANLYISVSMYTVSQNPPSTLLLVLVFIMRNL